MSHSVNLALASSMAPRITSLEGNMTVAVRDSAVKSKPLASKNGLEMMKTESYTVFPVLSTPMGLLLGLSKVSTFFAITISLNRE
ncbi:MAG: hypothetical protein BWY72_01606 [Bacteroidetes bacterium ADurb.Bin416]|nr:MAG: hypothetical protein BWY72_01606 [Bacteroidetes bacterium ADurb.Bin416]